MITATIRDSGLWLVALFEAPTYIHPAPKG